MASRDVLHEKEEAVSGEPRGNEEREESNHFFEPATKIIHEVSRGAVLSLVAKELSNELECCLAARCDRKAGSPDKRAA